MKAAPGEVTRLLARISEGEHDAVDQLIPLLYRELKTLAGHALQSERQGHTLQPTALAHEAYIRLVGQREPHWENRAHFMAVAANLMRQILCDYARRRHARKRPDHRQQVDMFDDR